MSELISKAFENVQPPEEPYTYNCHKCYDCLSMVKDSFGLPLTVTMMVVCPDCGNKRCSHATNHDNDCTGSNDPGQTGSRYA